MNLPKWQCPSNIVSADFNITNTNSTYILTGSPEHKEIWMTRLKEIQGSIMCAALFEILVGATGFVGIMMRFIGPLTICPTVTLLGLSLFKSASNMASKQWWITGIMIFLMMLFSQFLGNIQLPCCMWSKREGCRQGKLPIFKMFAVVFSILIGWLICYVLTVSDVFSSEPGQFGYEARTDIRINALYSSPWFRLPYPGQWGIPTVSISGVCAILCGIIATTIESVGDYHACAKLAGAPPPPLTAINRGILVEGLGSFLDGLFGTGNGTTSTSINVGVVGLTKVGCRSVVQFSALFMIILGLFTKFGALFITVPDPVIAGSFFVLFGMIVAVGLSNLQHVNMNSGRNMFIVGFSLFTGLAIPQWIQNQSTPFDTGNLTVDNVLTVLLSQSMFVGGVIGFALDNTISGTSAERGVKQLEKTRKNCSEYFQQRVSITYDLPISTETVKKCSFLKYFPFSPTFEGYCCQESTNAV